MSGLPKLEPMELIQIPAPFDDPDGNNVEVYVDTSDVWKHDTQRVASAKPLEL